MPCVGRGSWLSLRPRPRACHLSGLAWMPDAAVKRFKFHRLRVSGRVCIGWAVAVYFHVGACGGLTSSWVAADADAPGLRSKASEGLGISWRLCLPELLCFGWLASLVLLWIEGPAGRCITAGVSRYWNGWLGVLSIPSRFGIRRFPPWGDCCRSLPSLPCAAGSCRSMLSSPLSAQRSMLDSTAPTYRCAARPRVACSAPGPC